MKNKQNLKIWLVTVLTLMAMVWGITACKPESNTSQPANSSTLSRVIQTKKIRAAYIIYPPTVIVKDDPKKPTGFLIDIMDEIAKQAQVEVSYEPTTFDDFKLAINSDKYDIIVGGIFMNVARAREMALTEPVMYWAGVAAISSASRQNEFSDLESLNKPSVKIAVTAGTGEHDFVKRNLTNATVNALPNGDLSLTLSEVTAGRADVAFADAITIRKFIQNKPNLAMLFDGRQFNTFATSFVVKQKDYEWLNFINASITSLHLDGTIESLTKKWGGEKMWLLPTKPWE